MNKYTGCGECARVWEEYSRLTHEQIRLEGKLKMASFQHQHATATELAAEVQKVASRKAEVREAILRHGAEPHSDSAVAGE